MPSDHAIRAAAFLELHRRTDILTLPGVWDAASARVFAAGGFAALGTTSAGVAWSLGYATGQDAPWPVFLDACRRIAAAVDVPVSFDLEAGFGATPEAIRARVDEAIDAGACGVNLEDGRAGGTLRDADLLAAAISAIRERCARRSRALFVNARTDVYLGGVTGVGERLDETIRRGRRWAEAGADGFFVPGIADVEAIRAVVTEVPLPLNVYALPGVPPAARLAALGVRRVSVGCGPLQAVLARTRAMARALRHDGDWACFTDDWLAYPEAVALSIGAGRVAGAPTRARPAGGAPRGDRRSRGPR